MALPLTKLGRDVYAPVTAGGVPRGADMGDASVHSTEIEKLLEALVAAAGGITLTDDVIYAINGGAGTANAVKATATGSLSTTPGAQLITVPFTASNTGPMTVSINGETPRPLVTNTGEPIPAGYVTAKMAALVQIDVDGNYRLFSYGDTSAIQAAVEAILVEAKAARDAALGAVPTVFSPTLADLKALDTVTKTASFLKADGRAGQFLWKGVDLSAQVTADPAEAIYVAPASDPTGASGAWVRSGFTEVDGRWWGLVGDGVADDTAALKAFILAGLNAYPEMDQVLPSGTYKFDEKINLLNPFGTLRGKGQAVLKYTGPAITNILDVSPSESYYFNQTIKDLWIQGNAGSQVLLRTHNIHHSVFENINLRDAHSGYPAMQTEAAVLNTYRNIRCSHNPAFDISVPYNGINFGSGTGSATQTIACIMENLIVEGVLSGGISLVNAAYNRFIGGSSEGNGGLGLYIVDGSDHNHINGMFFEANTGGDIYVGGNHNRFVTMEAVSDGGAAGSVEVGGDHNVFEGGRIKKITIDGSAVGTVLRDVTVETIVDNGSFTVIENCYDWAGNRIPDKTPITIILSGPTSSRPLSPTVGQLYYDTTIQKLIVWNSAAWTTTDGAGV